MDREQRQALIVEKFDSQVNNEARKATIEQYKHQYHLEITLKDFLEQDQSKTVVTYCYQKARELMREKFPFVSELAQRIRNIYLKHYRNDKKYFFYDGGDAGAIRLELAICFEIILITALHDFCNDIMLVSQDHKSGFCIEVAEYDYRLTVWGEFS